MTAAPLQDDRVTAAVGPALREELLGVVVVNYGPPALLERHLATLELDHLPVRVVVVDNFSTAPARRAVRDLAGRHGWRFVGMPDNRGFGAGVNAGIAAARDAGCTCYLLLNPDARIEPAAVEELRRHVVAHPMDLVSPRIVTPAGQVWFDGARLALRSGRVRGRASTAPPPPGPQEEWLTGACLAVHEQLLQRSGGMDESLFLYWEDIELSHRCRTAGGRLVVRRDLVAVHDVGGTQTAGRGRGKSAVYYRYNCRNRLVFAARHLDRRDLLRWVAATPSVAWEVLRRGGRRQLLRRPGLVLAAARGCAAGLAAALPALVRGRRHADAVLAVHPGAELYGSDRMFLEAVAGLAAGGRRVVAAVPGPGPLVAALRDAGAEVVTCRMPVLRKAALRPRGALRLAADAVAGLLPAWRLLRRTGRGPVYVSTQTIPMWPVLGRLARRRVVLHVHEAEGQAPAAVRRALALPAVLADRVVLNSRYSRDVLVSSLRRVSGRCTVVPNGIPAPAAAQPPRPALTGPVRLLFLGRLSPRKGPQVAVAALAELRRRGIDARLTLAGSAFEGYGWFADELAAAVRREGLEDRVEFAGFVAEPGPLLAGCDVLLVPSVLAEPFGNTAVEGLLAARPVVVSDVGGLPEAVAGAPGASTAPPGDAAGWADAVARVVEDWPRLAAAAPADADRARERYAPERYRAALTELVTTPERSPRGHHRTAGRDDRPA